MKRHDFSDVSSTHSDASGRSTDTDISQRESTPAAQGSSHKLLHRVLVNIISCWSLVPWSGVYSGCVRPAA